MANSDHSSSNSTISAWTLILRAQGKGPDGEPAGNEREASQALGELLSSYRSFIVWFMGVLRPPPDLSVDDLFQEYALTVIRQDVVKELQKRGSLRGWFKQSIRYFILNEWDKYYRRRRMVPTEFERFSNTTEADIDAAFLATLVNQAIALTQARTVNSRRFQTIVRFLPGPQADFVKHEPYATEVGLSHGHLNQLIWKERKSFDACFDEIVMGTLDLGDDAGDPERVRRRVEAEKRELRALLDSPVAGVVFSAVEERN